MIYNRTHLQLEHVVDDNGILQLNGDGSAMASNKKVFIALAPVEPEIKQRLTVLEESDLNAERVSITPETAKEVLKNVPKDRKFGGLLEHVEVRDTGGEEVAVKMVDGKRSRLFNFKKRGRFSEQETVLKYIYRIIDSDSVLTLCLNRKRLLSLLEAMDKVSEDVSGEAPVWLSVSEKGDISIRGWDFKYGRAVLGFMSANKGREAEKPPRSDWENRFSEKERILPKRKLLKRKGD